MRLILLWVQTYLVGTVAGATALEAWFMSMEGDLSGVKLALLTSAALIVTVALLVNEYGISFSVRRT